MFLLTTNPSKIVARLNIVTRLTAVITLLLLPLVVQAQAPTVPASPAMATTTVTWNTYYMWLEEKVRAVVAGQWSHAGCARNENLFDSKSAGTYSYRAGPFNILSLHANVLFSLSQPQRSVFNASA